MSKHRLPSLRRDFNGAADRPPQFGVHSHADVELYFRDVREQPAQNGPQQATPFAADPAAR